MLRAVGIDLGTTNSLMAFVNAGGHTEMLRDRDGDLHIPSLVFFDDERVIVGKDAQLRARRKPCRLASSRIWGSVSTRSPSPMSNCPPEVIQGCILQQLKETIRHRLGSEYGAVIGVPAYFNDNQRRGTAEAAQMAGLELLDVFNEPAAAALAFGEHLLLPHQGASGGGAYVLVYDLGGYAFEATLLHCDEESFTTLASDREESLGGNDWDRSLADYLAEQFRTRHGIHLKAEPGGLDLLFGLTMRAKHALGVRPATTVSVPQSGVPVSFTVTRDEFERLAGADPHPHPARLDRRRHDLVRRLARAAGRRGDAHADGPQDAAAAVRACARSASQLR